MRYVKATAKQISDFRRELQNPYALQDGNGNFSGVIASNHLNLLFRPAHPYVSLGNIEDLHSENIQIRNINVNKSNQYAWIERDVHELHLKVWEQRHQFIPKGEPIDPLKLLEPSIAIGLLGYTYDEANYLGTLDSNDSNKEIAGILDRVARRIGISRKSCNKKTSRFTAAHELGHARLHKELTMHRDLPIDGPHKINATRPAIEIEADKFAAYYLMPEKLVRRHFEQIFSAELFLLTDDTAYALVQFNSDELIDKCKTLRDLARVLAKAEQYNGFHMESLAFRFGVSDETMAIRIEELELIKI